MTFPSGFQKPEVGSLICTWQRYVTCSRRFISVTSPADHLAASMAAKPFSSMYLWASIGGPWNWSLSCHCCLTVVDQADALPTELCRLGSSEQRTYLVLCTSDLHCLPVWIFSLSCGIHPFYCVSSSLWETFQSVCKILCTSLVLRRECRLVLACNIQREHLKVNTSLVKLAKGIYFACNTTCAIRVCPSI